MAKEFTIEGGNKFLKGLGKLEKKLVNKVIRQAMRKNLKPMASDAKQKAPVETGALKRSIKIKAGKRRKNIISVSIVVTGGHDQPIPMHVETGTSKMAAKPFLRPAFNHNSDQSLSDTVKEIVDNIENFKG